MNSIRAILTKSIKIKSFGQSRCLFAKSPHSRIIAEKPNNRSASESLRFRERDGECASKRMGFNRMKPVLRATNESSSVWWQCISRKESEIELARQFLVRHHSTTATPKTKRIMVSSFQLFSFNFILISDRFLKNYTFFWLNSSWDFQAHSLAVSAVAEATVDSTIFFRLVFVRKYLLLESSQGRPISGLFRR